MPTIFGIPYNRKYFYFQKCLFLMDYSNVNFKDDR